MKLAVKLELERGDEIVEVEVAGVFSRVSRNAPYESEWDLNDMEVWPSGVELTEEEFATAAEELNQKLEML